MRRIPVYLLSVTVLAAASACGKSSPAAPDPTSGGATINGVIVGGSSVGAAGLTVFVVGANVGSRVDGSNHFSLSGVPAGDTALQFTGSGTNARLALGSVTDGGSMDIKVNVDGTSATLETEDVEEPANSSDPAQQEIEGLVEALPPFTAAGSFIVNGHTILTNGSTQYRHGDTTMFFADLTIGTRVHVKGTPSGTSTLATLVIFQDPNVHLDVNLQGTVAGLSGPQSGFTFTVNGTTVKGDATTTFQGGAFSDLHNGTSVEIKGQQENGFVHATRIHILK